MWLGGLTEIGLRHKRVFALAAVALLAVCWGWHFAVFQVDDVFILYRYAANLAHGEGFVFNPGQRVEGVSSFAWTLMLVPLAWLGADLPQVVPLLTLLSGVVALLILPAIVARTDGRSTWEARDVVASALVGATPPFAYWAVGSLEAVPYLLLLLLALHSHLAPAEPQSFRSAWWMGLACLTRPEAPVMVVALAVDRALREATWLGRAHAAVAYGSRSLTVLAPFLLWRRWYFGEWLPNTYFAKTGGDPAVQLAKGLHYLGYFMAEASPWAGPWVANLLTLIALAVVIARALLNVRTRAIGLMFLASVGAVVWEGGDWMPLYRFLLPSLTFLLLVVSHLLLRPTLTGIWRAVPVTIAMMFLGHDYAWGELDRDWSQGLVVNADGYRYAHFEVARYLREHAHPNDELAAMDIGILGYETGLPVFDISGLTEPVVAHSPGGFTNKEYSPSLVLDRHPRYIALVFASEHFIADERIAADPDFQANYQLVLARNARFRWTPPGKYVLALYERRP